MPFPIDEHRDRETKAIAHDLARAIHDSWKVDNRYLQETGIALSRDQQWEILILNLFFATAAVLRACAGRGVAASGLTDAFYEAIYERTFDSHEERGAFTDHFLGRWRDYRGFLTTGTEAAIRQRIRVLESNLGIVRPDGLAYLTGALVHRTEALHRQISHKLVRPEAA